MLAESHPRSNQRPLRDDERRLVEALLRHHPNRRHLIEGLADVVVEDMVDGGMGSVRFTTTPAVERQLGGVAAQAEWRDTDGVPVSIALNLDTRGDLYELDIWKVNFAPLLTYPRAEDVRISDDLRML